MSSGRYISSPLQKVKNPLCLMAVMTANSKQTRKNPFEDSSIAADNTQELHKQPESGHKRTHENSPNVTLQPLCLKEYTSKLPAQVCKPRHPSISMLKYYEDYYELATHACAKEHHGESLIQSPHASCYNSFQKP